MEKFTEEAAKAAEGMRDLAAASDLLEAAGDKTVLWAARVVGSFMNVSQGYDRFITSGGVGGFLGRTKRFLQGRGPVFGMDEETGRPEKTRLPGSQWAGGKLMTGDAGIKVGAAGGPPSAAETKAAEAERKRAQMENEKAQALGRREHFRDLRNKDAIERTQSDYAKAVTALSEPGAVTGQGTNADRIRRIGGAVGISRPGIEREDRQLRILKESKEIQKEYSTKLQELIDKIDEQAERGE